MRKHHKSKATQRVNAGGDQAPLWSISGNVIRSSRVQTRFRPNVNSSGLTDEPRPRKV